MKQDPQFEMIRQLPPALSEEEIQKVVIGFSALGWWMIVKSFFHLNTNIMIFSASITIAGLISFSTLSTPSVHAEQGLILPEAVVAPIAELPAVPLSPRITSEKTSEEPVYTMPAVVSFPSTALEAPEPNDLLPLAKAPQKEYELVEKDSLDNPKL
ncbi:MAG: hypothetical protein AAGH79_17310 [Bacteroidota bacterium]